MSVCVEVAIGARAQLRGDLGRGACPVVQSVHHFIDGYAHGIAPRGVYAARGGAVESQAGQMSPDRGVDDVGRRVVLARGVEHRRNVDMRGVRFSHTGYDACETRLVPVDSVVLADRLGDTDRQLAGGVLVGGLHHYPHHLLGSRGPQQDSASVAELGFGLGDG